MTDLQEHCLECELAAGGPLALAEAALNAYCALTYAYRVRCGSLPDDEADAYALANKALVAIQAERKTAPGAGGGGHWHAATSPEDRGRETHPLTSAPDYGRPIAIPPLPDSDALVWARDLVTRFDDWRAQLDRLVGRSKYLLAEEAQNEPRIVEPDAPRPQAQDGAETPAPSSGSRILVTIHDGVVGDVAGLPAGFTLVVRESDSNGQGEATDGQDEHGHDYVDHSFIGEGDQ